MWRREHDRSLLKVMMSLHHSCERLCWLSVALRPAEGSTSLHLLQGRVVSTSQHPCNPAQASSTHMIIRKKLKKKHLQECATVLAHLLYSQTQEWHRMRFLISPNPPWEGLLLSAPLSLHIYSNAGRPWHYPQCTEAESVITTPIQTELLHSAGVAKDGGGERDAEESEREMEEDMMIQAAESEKFTFNLSRRELLHFTPLTD